MTTAQKVLEASTQAGRLVLPDGISATAVACNAGKGIAFLFADGSELTVGKVTIDAYGFATSPPVNA